MENMNPLLVGLALWTLAGSVSGSSLPCALKDFGRNKRVCVCNATYCDTIDRVQKINEGEFIVFISSRDGLRFDKRNGKLIKTTPSNSESSQMFTVDRAKKCQKMIGFGGAFTDSAGINILSLGKQTQEHLLRSYFSEEGIEYNLCRVPIGGTDFSTHPYSYDDGAPDPGLEHFSLAKEDLKYKIPLIQRAVNMSARDIFLVAAAWSPPPWMKTNNEFSGFAFLREEYYDPYTKYLLRFLDEYKKRNVKIWAMSTGNEPSNGVLPIKRFNSLGWTPSSMANWTTNILGPQLRGSVHKDTILLAFDDQRLFLPWWIEMMVNANEDVLKYVDGFAIHWYWDFMISPAVVNFLHEKHPGQFILYTEASLGDKPWEWKVDLGSWERGEKYIGDIIQNTNAWVTGWMDWNLALDLSGGPNWAKNYVDSPILVNVKADEFYKQPMFYAIGHVSKFIERDARRIDTSPTESKRVHVMAVENPGGRIVIVMLNENFSEMDVSIYVSEKGWINQKLPAKSFATILC